MLRRTSACLACVVSAISRSLTSDFRRWRAVPLPGCHRQRPSAWAAAFQRRGSLASATFAFTSFSSSPTRSAQLLPVAQLAQSAAPRRRRLWLAHPWRQPKLKPQRKNEHMPETDPESKLPWPCPSVGCVVHCPGTPAPTFSCCGTSTSSLLQHLELEVEHTPVTF